MALVKKVTLTVFQAKPFEVKGDDGQVYTGSAYKGFDSAGVVHSFTSKREGITVHDAGGYDSALVQDFVLEGRTWDDKTKWQFK